MRWRIQWWLKACDASGWFFECWRTRSNPLYPLLESWGTLIKWCRISWTVERPPVYLLNSYSNYIEHHRTLNYEHIKDVGAEDEQGYRSDLEREHYENPVRQPWKRSLCLIGNHMSHIMLNKGSFYIYITQFQRICSSLSRTSIPKLQA